MALVHQRVLLRADRHRVWICHSEVEVASYSRSYERRSLHPHSPAAPIAAARSSGGDSGALGSRQPSSLSNVAGASNTPAGWQTWPVLLTPPYVDPRALSRASRCAANSRPQPRGFAAPDSIASGWVETNCVVRAACLLAGVGRGHNSASANRFHSRSTGSTTSVSPRRASPGRHPRCSSRCPDGAP